VVVGVLRADLRLYGVQNLKQKRGVVQKMLSRCRNKFPVSAAEVDHQDLWQRCELGFSVVNTNDKIIMPILQRIEQELSTYGDVELLNSEIEFIHF
jgi:uncharacterized protein YlxP (DUF503 family)